MNSVTDTTVVKVDTPDECCGEDKTYYVGFKDGNFRVGRQGEDPFMEWTDPEYIKVGRGRTHLWSGLILSI